MLKNCLQVAVRHMRQSRFYPLVNMIGLAIGLVSAILIATSVPYLLSYEAFLQGVE